MVLSCMVQPFQNAVGPLQHLMGNCCPTRPCLLTSHNFCERVAVQSYVTVATCLGLLRPNPSNSPLPADDPRPGAFLALTLQAKTVGIVALGGWRNWLASRCIGGSLAVSIDSHPSLPHSNLMTWRTSAGGRATTKLWVPSRTVGALHRLPPRG